MDDVRNRAVTAADQAISDAGSSGQAPSSIGESLHWRRSAGILQNGLSVKTKPQGDRHTNSTSHLKADTTPNADITEDDLEANQQFARHLEFAQASMTESEMGQENCNETEVTVGPSKRYPELMR